MGCCGQGRKAVATLRTARAHAPVANAPSAASSGTLRPPDPADPAAPRPARPVLPDGPAILVRYLARVPVRIVGAATGRRYDFRPEAPLRLVAREDAVILLGSPSFRLA